MVKSTHILAWQHEPRASRDCVLAVVGLGGVIQCFIDALFNVGSLSEGVPLINVIFFWLPFVDALPMFPCILLTLPIPELGLIGNLSLSCRPDYLIWYGSCDPLVDLILSEPQLLVSCESQCAT
ncbi:hypothetical protein Tco_1570322 [Tanacetum coccineum]